LDHEATKGRENAKHERGGLVAFLALLEKNNQVARRKKWPDDIP